MDEKNKYIYFISWLLRRKTKPNRIGMDWING